MFHKTLLLLLPVVACAKINIRGELSKHSDSHGAPYYSFYLSHNGTIEDVISDEERQTWLITDQRLKEMIEICPWTPTNGSIWQRPDDVFVRSPTLWYDLYKDVGYNIKEVRRILKPRDYPVIQNNIYYSNPIYYESDIIRVDTMYNPMNISKEHTVPKLNFGVAEIMTTTWHTDGELTANGKDISYEFICQELDMADISFTGSWGKNELRFKPVEIEYMPNFTVKLEPGELAAYVVTAIKQTLYIDVHFEAYLEGDVVLNYANKFDGHHFHFLYVNDILNECDRCDHTMIRKEVFSNVTIKIVTYADAKLAIYRNWSGLVVPVSHEPISNRINFEN